MLEAMLYTIASTMLPYLAQAYSGLRYHPSCIYVPDPYGHNPYNHFSPFDIYHRFGDLGRRALSTLYSIYDATLGKIIESLSRAFTQSLYPRPYINYSQHYL